LVITNSKDFKMQRIKKFGNLFKKKDGSSEKQYFKFIKPFYPYLFQGGIIIYHFTIFFVVKNVLNYIEKTNEGKFDKEDLQHSKNLLWFVFDLRL
jgi:hypothetical protein